MRLEGTTFSLKLRHYRKAADLTQQELADRASCSRSIVHKFEAGERRPSKQVAELLADCLNLSGEERADFLRSARAVPGARSDRDSRSTPASAKIDPGTKGTYQAQRENGAVSTHLPGQLTRLIGRDKAVETLTARLMSEEVRFLTLTGAPGIGKTRLGLAVASAMLGLGTFQDGVFFVDLATMHEPQLVLEAIAQATGFKDMARDKPLLDGLMMHLHDSQMLLVLDNLEQVLSAGPMLAELLAHCSQLRMLTTSREPLRVRGEWQYSVPPLDVPDIAHLPAAAQALVDALSGNPAVSLFMLRAQAADISFEITAENALDIAAICVRLDGLPLAIELVASRINLMSPRAILSRFPNERDGEWHDGAPDPERVEGERSYLSMLSSGQRDLPARQQTLRDCIGWSYDLLSSDEQRLFARLAVFAGGFTLESTDAVCNAHSDLGMSTLEGIALLQEKSLIKRSKERADEETRYVMLETIHEYAWERLVEWREGAEADAIRHLHAEYYLALVQLTTEQLTSSAERAMWARRLSRDYDNLRAILRYAVDKSDARLALQLSASMAVFWEENNFWREGQEWLARALAIPTIDDQQPASGVDVIKAARATALWAAGRLHTFGEDSIMAFGLYEESLALRRELQDAAGICSTLVGLGNLAWARGDCVQALLFFEESLLIRRELNDEWGVLNSLLAVGYAARDNGDYMRARAVLTEALGIARELNDLSLLAAILRVLGDVAGAEGDFKWADILLAEALALVPRIDRIAGMWVLAGCGFAALRRKEYARSEHFFEKALHLARQIGEDSIVSYSLEGLEGLAQVASAYGEAESSRRAALLFGAAEVIRDKTKANLPPGRRRDYERAIAAAHLALDDASFDRAWAKGRAMTLKQVVNYVLESE